MRINFRKENMKSEYFWMLYLLWIGFADRIVHERISSILDRKIEKLKKKQDELAISPQVIKDIEKELTLQVDHNKMFLCPGLTLNKVAKKLGYPVYAVSWVLNNHMKTCFRDFVNSMRIREAKKLIDQGYLETQTMIALVYESGFSAKSSFNRVFKLKTGITPSQYARDKNRTCVGR